MTRDDIDAEYRADMRVNRKVVIWAFGMFVVIVVAAIGAVLWLLTPTQTVGECIAKNVEMYVENQASGPNGGWVASDAGKQAARDQAQHGCERFSDAG